jgi:hypothetical protein
MKNLIKILSFAAILGFFATSCNTDPCKDVVCGDFGTCNEGTCACETGYEQNLDGLCNTEIRAKFKGTWNVLDACNTSGSGSFICSVTDANTTNNLQLKITNVWDQFTNQVNATVDGNTITFSRQAPDNDGYFVSGSGTINAAGNTITMSYTVTDETDPNNITTDICTSTWTK